MSIILPVDDHIMNSYGLQRLALIKQMHSIILASAKATSPANTNAIISSLVLGDYFVHSYHFRIQDEDSSSFLILQTYPRNANTCYGCMYSVANLRIAIIHETQQYLRVS